MSYIELHAASAFSFLDGASLPETLVQRASELDYPALALLDRDGVYGIPRFHQAATRAGIKAIVGAELTVRTGVREFGRSGRRQLGASTASRELPRLRSSELPSSDSRLTTLPVLVSSRDGYRNLSRLVTRMKLGAPKGEGALTLDDLDGHVGGLVALAGRTAIGGLQFGVGGLLDRLVGIFGASNVCVELQRHLLRDQESDNQMLRELASAYHLPLIASNGVRFAEVADRPLYDVLTCIRHKTTLERAGTRLSWNAERYLKPAEAMARLFNDIPDAIIGTRELADRLEYSMKDLGYRFPEYPVPSDETMPSFLRKITQAGAHQRYRPYHDRARAQIARELDLIEKLDLAGYFLIVWDIVNFCRQQDILVQGRGSAANSAVCYSLGITAVDPVGMDLLFERFLSEERGEWPDIDLDLPSGDRRERVIQHLYQKYGGLGGGPEGPRIAPEGPRIAPEGPRIAPEGPRIAMTANVITYRGRSAAREVGKVLSLEAAQIDQLAKVMNQFEFVDPKDTLDRDLRAVGIDVQAPVVRHFAHVWERIQDLPRHLGQHSGGMVICQGRLDEIVPLENASMPDRVVIQWDKDDCADMGLVKVDLLGLGMMAVLQDALTIVNTKLGRSDVREFGRSESHDNFRPSERPTVRPSELPSPDFLDLAHLPPDDPAIYRMLQEADTIGIFQVESRAQMATLPRLKPKTFYDIVVEVAIIRPGPIVGQMVHPYLKRRQGTEDVRYPHPSLEPILKRTLGVPLFQEQLLRIAMVAAGFSGGEAEELRRAMGFKRSEKRMQQIEGKLRAGMARQGITGDAAEQIIRSITSFALYGFPESHAASFALLVYASAYLKVHFPAAFYTAMLNNQPMGFYHPATLVKDAQRRGVRFAPIDVQESDWECRVESDGRIRLGLMYVNGLREEVGKRIAEPRLAARSSQFANAGEHVEPKCPKCGCDDQSMLEVTPTATWFCNVCAYEFKQSDPRTANCEPRSATRYDSVDSLVAQTSIRRDELATLAEIGALNSLGHDRRSALWQIEQSIRPAGKLFESVQEVQRVQEVQDGRVQEVHAVQRVQSSNQPATPLNPMNPMNPTFLNLLHPLNPLNQSPLHPMTSSERLKADYDGTSLTIGPHPMAFCRGELAVRGVQRATDLPLGRSGRRVRVAGAVITRQRPGTAKGFVFLTLEDETGIANVIVRPDLFSDARTVIVNAPYLLVEGILQIQDGVTSVKAERMQSLAANAPEPQSHDFR